MNATGLYDPPKLAKLTTEANTDMTVAAIIKSSPL